MRLRMMVVLLLSGLLMISASAAAAETKHEKIKRKDVPKKVMEAFKKDFPKAKIQEIEKETYEDGTIHYEFKFKAKDGKKREVEYDEEGEQLEEHDEDAAEKEKPQS